MEESKHDQQNDNLPLAEEKEHESDALALKIEEELTDNPVVLERLLSRPQFQAIVSQQYFRGPLPPPAMLREYDSIIQDGAERIMGRGEKEQAHRHAIKNKTVDGTISKDKRGQWMAFIITMTILAIATVFAWKGNTVFAGALITIDLIGLASVFLLGRVAPSSNKKEEDKDEK